MIKSLIRCIPCNAVIPDLAGLSEYKKSFLPGVECSPEDLDRQRDFSQFHHGHQKEKLHLIPDSHFAAGDEPGGMKVSFFEAGNGRERFLIRRTKPGLGHPAVYEIVRGRLRVHTQSLNIQEEDLRKQISLGNGYAPLTQDKVEKFIKVFREEIKTIPPEKARQELEIEEGNDSPLAFGTLKQVRWDHILQRCKEDFGDDDLVKIRKFIDLNNGPDDVLALRVEQKISVYPSPNGKSLL